MKRTLASLAVLLWLVQPAAIADQSLNLLDKAYRYHNQLKHSKALEAANEAVRLKPNQPEVLLARAHIEIGNLMYKEAARDCDSVLKLNPKSAGAYSRRGYSYCRLGQYEKGIADLTKSIELNQVEMTSWDACFDYKNRAIAYRHLGKTKLAEKDEAQAQILNAIQRARGYRMQIQLAPAVALMNEAVSKHPDNLYLRYFRGVAEMNDGRLSDAIADFTFVAQHDPACTSVLYFRGDCHSRLHQMQASIDDYSTIIARKPYLVAVSDTAETGRCKGRELTYDESIVSVADIYVLRSKQYARLKQLDKALKDLDHALELAPDDKDARQDRANLYLTMKKYPLAIQECSTILAKNPKSLKIYETRANVYIAANQLEKALQDYDKMVAIADTDPPIYLLRGQLLFKLGRYDKAIADFTTVSKLNPSEDDAFRLRGDCFLKLNQFEKAVSDYSEAISRDKAGNIDAYASRAIAYEKLGRQDLAQKDKQTFRDNSPKSTRSARNSP